MKFRPLHNKVLVLPDPKKKETSFGLLLPDDQERPKTGTVVVGNSDVKKGQKILFSLFGLDEFELEGKPHAVVSDKGVLGIYE